ncbi:minor histocompatibility protein HA-1-like [Elysia marginata]|uniref:Minor histocompatibility protein HA-1-like n=1 Tax=Elysia marginata TaxID=1093978 RepID=A0AAV4IXR9_9GAST|nr:minor histocompatibility protein HA-1-like [Elysia marginata]
MSSKGRQIAKNIGKTIKKKFESDHFLFPIVIDEDQLGFHFLVPPVLNSSSHGSPPLSARRLMQRTMQGTLHLPKKSSSMGTISTATDEAHDQGMIDHDEIIALTQDVKKFSDSLARLKLLFTDGFDAEEDARVVIHEGLGEVLSVLNPVMQHYPELQSPDIFTAARGLISLIKDHDYGIEMTSISIQNFCDAIDQLALAFSSSVSEYLMGDLGPQLVMDLKARSMNNVSVEEEIIEKPEEEADEVDISPKDLDSILVSMETGLGLALQRAKVWSKYIADIITYIEKKAQLELDYSKNMSRLAHNLQHSLKKEGFLPLQSVYCTVLNQDTEFANNLQVTQSLLQAQKFIEPLSMRRSEHDKVYKSVKDVWHREYRRMTESVTNLRKAQALYNSRQQDRDRAREMALKAEPDKVEKRRKAEEETMHKAAEAETTYKACVAEANYRQQELFKVKAEQLARIREQIQMCDQTMKEVTGDYFQLYHTIVSPLPLQYLTLSESTKNYVPGSQYAEYVRRLPSPSRPCQPAVFMFEPYIQGQKSSEVERKESVHSNGSVSELHSPEGSPVASPRRDKYRIPVKAWGQQIPGGTSDTDSASCCSSKSQGSSPSGSPHRGQRRLVSSHSLDELTEEEILAAASAQHQKDKRAHQMKRMMSVQGADNLEMPGLLMSGRTHRRNTTFGVDFQEQVDTFQTKVPPIVSKCLEEIEKRGHMVKGIYRVSGVKSKVEHLCQRFDIDPEAVDLSDVHPNIISNVLKLYLRQLPEPLLTFRLYSEFIHTAKENMSGQLVGDQLVDKLQKLIRKLPSSNLRTSAVLMHHLHRVADNAEVNQMSASNLGIVFGPTLLRPLEGSASLASLVDTPHQTRAIELLVTHAHVIFGPSEDFQVSPGQTPIEQLDDRPADQASQGQKSSKKSNQPTSSEIADDETSGLGTSCSAGASTSTGPSPCEFVLPGTANQEKNDSQSIAINGFDLGLEAADWNSDEGEETPDIPLPDKSIPQANPFNVALSPWCIQAGGQGQDMIRLDSQSSTSSMPPELGSEVKQTGVGQVTKSASSPSVAHAGFLLQSIEDHKTDQHVTAGEKSKSEEGQSTVSVQETEAGKKTREETTEKKRPHSQQLKNIKYLTKAPSFEDTVDDFYPKTTFVPAEPALPHGGGECKSGPVTQSASSEKTVVDEKPGSKPGETESKPGQTQTVTPCHKPLVSGILPRPSPVASVSSSRRSILEEMPIPTMSPPVASSFSDGSKCSEAAMTIPASPTIRRREISTSQSKIPTSPGPQRAADHKDSGRQDKLRLQQRKLVTAIKTDPKIGVASNSSSVSSQPSERGKSDVGKSKSVTKSSVFYDDGFSGGCALSSRPSSQSEETLGAARKSNLVQDSTDAKHIFSADQTQDRKKMPDGKAESPSLMRSTQLGKPESPRSRESAKQRLQPTASPPSLAKPRPFTLPSSHSQKKTATSTSAPSKTSGSISATLSTAKTTSLASSSTSNPQQAISGSPAPEPVKRTTQSASVASSQSPSLGSKAAKVSPGMGSTSSLKKSTSEDSSSTTPSLSSGKPSPVTSSVSRKGSGKAGDISSSSIKPTRKTTTAGGAESSPVRHRKTSGESSGSSQPPSKPVQRKTSGSGTPTGSPRRIHDRCQGEATSRPSSRTQKPSSSSACGKSSSAPSDTTAASTTSSTAAVASSKLSQDRTPRFV